MKIGQMKCLLIINKCQSKNQSHQIIVALDLIALNFNDILTIHFFFLKFNLTMSDDLMGKKLGINPNHRMKKV